MSKLNELFSKGDSSEIKKTGKYNELELIKMRKKTENGDDAFNTTGNGLLDILFMTEYFQKRLDEVHIGESEREKLFSMFMRDPRYGMGKRDLGRELMKQSKVSALNTIIAGRYDDLLYNPTNDNIKALYDAVAGGNELAKKWCPRLNSKDRIAAKALARMWFPGYKSEEKYRKFIKVTTTESLLTEKKYSDINFEHVPSLAMSKYYGLFSRVMEDRFKEYVAAVKSGSKKLNVATQDVYNIFLNRNSIDAQMFFDAMPKISISCLPILDVSGSMGGTENGSIRGKATAIAHYLSKCSSYCNNEVITFSREPKLIKMGSAWSRGNPYNHSYKTFNPNPNTSDYINEINSLLHGDEVANTDFGKVMKLLSGLSVFPDYIVCLTDCEFDSLSTQSKDKTMQIFKSYGAKTKIVWWNFNDRNKTVPETDAYGNIFMSGYNPSLLRFLESGFDGNAFLDKLLEEYRKSVKI